MEIREFAHRILFGTRLSDKLSRAASLRDRCPGEPVAVPDAPGRPEPLVPSSRRTPPFPRVHELDDPRRAGVVLHFFANHELLAMELMALALLRFSTAPAAFRRGLVATIDDEQRHLKAYVDCMNQNGVALGDVPVGDFFWRMMAPIDEPAAFVAHMALTFEQANLDFAGYYAEAFERAGDEATASVLREVWTDEIRHVGRGLGWFRRWRPDAQDLFEAHGMALRPPLTLARAKGSRRFDVEARRAAGLPESYIRRLEILGASKGRPPVVHVYNAGCEHEIARGLHQRPSKSAQAAIADLEFVMAHVAAPDDVVLLRRRPTDRFLARLVEAGFAVPQLVESSIDAGPLDPRCIEHPKLGGVRPWGWSPSVARRLEPLDRRLPEPVRWRDSWRNLFSKVTAAALARDVDLEVGPQWWGEPEVSPSVVEDGSGLEREVARWRELGHDVVVAKAPFGTAGRGAVRIIDGIFDASSRRWCESTLRRQGALVVEPWHERIADLSLRLQIEPEGSVSRARIVSLGRFLTDARGQYLGAVLGRSWDGLEDDARRFLAGDGRDPKGVERLTRGVAARVGALARSVEYVGPIGVDGLLYRSRSGHVRLRPLLELNPRMNMGHVAVALQSHVEPGRAGLWVLVRISEAIAAGWPDLDRAIESLAAAHPLAVVQRGAKRWVRSGIVPTTDPKTAHRTGSVLVVGQTLTECVRAIEPLLRPDLIAALARG